MQAFLAKLVALFLSFLQSFVHVMCITNYSYLQNLVWYIFRLQLPQKVYSLQSKPRCCPKVTFPNFAKIFTSSVWEILIRKPISYLIHLGLNSYIILRHFCPFYFVLGLNTILSNIEQTRTSFSKHGWTRTCSSIGDQTLTPYFWLRKIEHRTSKRPSLDLLNHLSNRLEHHFCKHWQRDSNLFILWQSNSNTLFLALNFKYSLTHH